MFKYGTFNKAEQSVAAKIWQAIREAQTFTVDTLANQINLASQDIQGYVFWLCRCGYLKYGHDAIELIKNTGIGAPVALKSGFYDPNLV